MSLTSILESMAKKNGFEWVKNVPQQFDEKNKVSVCAWRQEAKERTYNLIGWTVEGKQMTSYPFAFRWHFLAWKYPNFGVFGHNMSHLLQQFRQSLKKVKQAVKKFVNRNLVKNPGSEKFVKAHGVKIFVRQNVDDFFRWY